MRASCRTRPRCRRTLSGVFRGRWWGWDVFSFFLFVVVVVVVVVGWGRHVGMTLQDRHFGKAFLHHKVSHSYRDRWGKTRE